MNVFFSTINRHRKKIEIFLFIIISFILLLVFGKNLSPTLRGDSHEYLLMQEAFVNHLSPELQTKDVYSARLHCCGNDTANCHPAFVSLEYFSKDTAKPMTEGYGYFAAYNGKKYCYHFWLYSLVTVPIHLVLDLIGANPFKSFQIFNVLLILATLAYILFIFRQSVRVRYITFLLFLFSANFFYLRWPHTEIFSSALFFMGFLLLFDKRYLLSVLCIALASTQNPPIAFFLPVVFLALIINEKFSVWKFLSLGFVSSICLLPSLFYWWNFHVPNLIIYSGFTKSELLCFDRLWSFFFDLNQGMVVAIPLILLSLPIAIINSVRKFEKQKIILFSLPVVAIIMSLPALQQTNWNAGCAVIQRYALWGSVPFTIFIIMSFDWKTRPQIFLASLLIMSQILLLQVEKWHHPDCNDYVQLNRLTKFIFDKAPSLYNPDPEIFSERVIGYEYDYKKYGYTVYTNSEGKIKKIWIMKSFRDSLRLQNYSQQQIDSLINNLKYDQFDQAYINMP